MGGIGANPCYSVASVRSACICVYPRLNNMFWNLDA